MTKYQHHHFSLNARGIVKNLTYEAGTNNEKSPTGDARAQQEWLLDASVSDEVPSVDLQVCVGGSWTPPRRGQCHVAAERLGDDTRRALSEREGELLGL